MKKKLRRILKFAFLIVLAVSFAIPTFATSLQEEEKKKSELEDDLKDASQILKNLESLKSDTYTYVQELSSKLSDINTTIKTLEQQSREKEQKISELNSKISEKELELQDQYASMKKRIQFMYENGQTGYIDMILGSRNLSEMLNKAEYLTEITGYDRSMLEQLNQTKSEIEQSKAQVETDQAEILVLKSQQEAKQNDIEILTNEKNAQLEQYANEISVTKNKQKELQAEISDQKSAIDEIKRKVDEQQKAREEEQNQGGNQGGGNSDDGGYTGGTLLWPVPGYSKISSDYTNRIHPIYGYPELHDGIDIPAPIGTQVLAADAGTVTISKTSASAGEYIVIYHGNNLYTEYMHMNVNSRSVRAGDTVTRGQVIGKVGNTGWSTGAHLHFSVNLQSGSSFSTGDRVNPHPYLGR